MKGQYGYQSYRGRMTLRKFLAILIGVLAVALALVVALYVYLQRYVVYTDEGARFELPFFQGESQPPEESGGVNIVVENSPAPSDGEERPETAEPLRAVWVPAESLEADIIQAQVEAAGGNAAVLDMKNADGTLNYVSQLDLARQAGANPAEDRNAALRELNQGELYTIARVACFKDGLLNTVDRSMNILTNSGYLWYGEDQMYWTSPASGEVRDYLTGIARELAELGFDEILLDFAGYPTQGNLGWIRVGESYPQGELDQWIGQFYQEMAQALEDYEVKLSIRTTEEALRGEDSLSGQTAQNLAAWADRIWVEPSAQEDTDYAALLAAAGMEGAEEALVLITQETEELTGGWARLP